MPDAAASGRSGHAPLFGHAELFDGVPKRLEPHFVQQTLQNVPVGVPIAVQITDVQLPRFVGYSNVWKKKKLEKMLVYTTRL